MNLKNKLLIAGFIFTSGTNTNAQMMWGTGMYGGMQTCPYTTSIGDGANSTLDDLKELESSIKDMQRQLQTKKRDKKKFDKLVELSERDIKSVVSDEYAEFALEHMQNARQCSEYKGLPGAEQILSVGTEGETPVAPVQSVDTKPFQVKDWASLCDPNKSGSVFPVLCDSSRYRQQGGDSRGDIKNCKKGLSEYRKNYSQSQKIQRDVDALERSISTAKDNMKDAKQAMIDEQRASTEGGVCVNCVANSAGYSYQQQNRGTDWANVAGNLLTGAVGMYAGYKNNQMVAQYNSNLGFPTTAYPTIGYGLPYIAAGLYGALGGGTGQGGFGCGSSNSASMMNGGAFGYPNSMYGNPAGGGMYMPGLMGMGGLGMNGMGMYDSSMSQMQMQLMQMQMQQYQSYMQQQMQRQQTVMSLQQELYSLLYRIQQVQYGAGISGTGYIGAGSNGTTFGGSISGGTITGTGSNYPNTGTATTPLTGSSR